MSLRTMEWGWGERQGAEVWSGGAGGWRAPQGREQTCVGAGVPLELVTPCEPLPTEEPVADKGPLASVQAHVSPQQGRLTESLAAVRDVAHVLLLALLSRPGNWVEGGVEGMGSRDSGEVERWGRDRMERGCGVRSESMEPLPGPLSVCVPGRAWGTGHTPGWPPGPSPQITSCPHPCSWDTCRPCGAASPQAGPLQPGLVPSAAGSGWGSAH